MAIDLKLDMKKVPKGVKIGLSFAPAAIISILVLMLIVMPKTGEIKNLKVEISTQDNEIAKNKAMAAKLDILKVENQKLNKRLAELQEQLPEEKEVSSLLKQISEVAAKSEVDILTWVPGSKKPHPSGIVEEIPFSLTLTGTYHNLGLFFSNLTRLNRIVNITNISLGGAQIKKDEATLSISLSASTFSAVKEGGK
jgi:type IV pilus assembly protein PilO